MIKSIYLALGFTIFMFPFFSLAENEAWNTKNIRLKHEYQHIIFSNLNKFIKKVEVKNNDEFCLDDENKKMYTQVVDTDGIKKYIEKNIVPIINQDQKNVTISMDDKGNILFDGFAQRGKRVNIEETINSIENAIKENIYYVTISVDITEPNINIDSEELKNRGIKELVAVGRSDFNGSSGKRIINIMAGSSKFNGHIIPKDSVFSFTDKLGPINSSTGYVKELVILGDKVLPEYGGGLCQVSSTSYRGAMIAGMEIVERHNHSYAVDYYEPAGSDATIYVGHKDFKFKNTSNSDLLLQTKRGGKNNKELFFIYYGTKTNRDVNIFGPLKNNYRKPLATKITYDESKPSNYSQTVSHRVTGFNASFFREVKENNKELYKDNFFSKYQARGRWVIRGAKEEPKEIEEIKENTIEKTESI
jgi:vancomycin resistance protein YoaR